MNPIISSLNLLPGDRIVEPKSTLQMVKHHSIYLGSDRYGTDWIVENKIGHGVRILTANQYFNSVTSITRIEKFTGSGYERKQAVQRALNAVGKPYDLINYNCEHFANYIQYGQASSNQVLGGFMLTFCLLILLGSFSD